MNVHTNVHNYNQETKNYNIIWTLLLVNVSQIANTSYLLVINVIAKKEEVNNVNTSKIIFKMMFL